MWVDHLQKETENGGPIACLPRHLFSVESAQDGMGWNSFRHSNGPVGFFLLLWSLLFAFQSFLETGHANSWCLLDIAMHVLRSLTIVGLSPFLQGNIFSLLKNILWQFFQRECKILSLCISDNSIISFIFQCSFFFLTLLLQRRLFSI